MAFRLMLCTFWAVAYAYARAPDTHPNALTSCLAQAHVPFLVQNSSEWIRQVTVYNLRLNYTPSAIAMPESTFQIQSAVLCGIKNKVRVTAKGGGHSFGSYGLGGEDGHLVIALSRMRRVMLRGDNTAKIQPGARLLEVATELDNQGHRAISHGSCLSVGISGHVLHGGYGYASQTHGLTLDWLVAATVVLANGSIAHCSATENKDLFWALRGAGSSFAIVAELEFDTFEAPKQNSLFKIELSWNQPYVVKAIEALQRFASTAPRELNLSLDISPDTKIIQGVYYGDRHGMHEALRPLLDEIGARISEEITTSWLEGLKDSDDTGTTDPDKVHETFYASSLFTHALTGDQVKSLVSTLFAQYRNPIATKKLYLSIEIHGGNNSAIADVSPSATAYVHRDKMLLFQLYHAGSHGHYPKEGFSLLRTIGNSVTRSMKKGDWGMLVNYLDTQLDAETAGWLYWGDNLPRLQEIKAKLDPSQVFWNPEGIRPASYPPTQQHLSN